MTVYEKEIQDLVSQGFKEVYGYPGYFVDRGGRVVEASNNEIQDVRVYTDLDGFKNVTLVDSFGVPELIMVHTLVAMMFIKNPDNLKEVRHLDGDKGNNTFTNLIWDTCNDDEYYIREKPGPIAQAVVKRDHHRISKKVYCYENNTVYDSINKAAVDLLLTSGRVTEYLKRGCGSIKGYHLCYDEDKDKFFSNPDLWFKNDKVFYGKNTDTQETFKFHSISAAASTSGIDRRRVIRMLENREFYNGWVFYRKGGN